MECEIHMKQFLYGGNIQGIQNFLGQSSKLREIAEGSFLVANAFNDEDLKKHFGWGENEAEIIQNAAGRLRILFSSEEKCKAFVFEMPKWMDSRIPGAQFIQAVVPVDGEISNTEFKRLEDNLMAQRSQVSPPGFYGLLFMQKSRQTGGAIVSKQKGNSSSHGSSKDEFVFLDRAKDQKRRVRAATRNSLEDQLGVLTDDFESEIERLGSGRGNWMAVVHIDGNGIGQLILHLGQSTKGIDLVNKRKKFSEDLQDSTKQALKRALNQTDNPIPLNAMRPILLGGDDLSLVIKGEYAVEFCKRYLSAFEEETKRILGQSLTACAGIAYTKTHFPFHSGLKISEMLCKRAKEASKSEGSTFSSILFHKVQDSVPVSFEDLYNKEIRAGGNILSAGPYALAEGPNLISINELIASKNSLSRMGEKDSDGSNKDKPLGIKGKLRTWLSLAQQNNDPTTRDEILRRLKKQIKKDPKTPLHDFLANDGFEIEKPALNPTDGARATMISDILLLQSVNDQTTL
jgi:hypothetical protein